MRKNIDIFVVRFFLRGGEGLKNTLWTSMSISKVNWYGASSWHILHCAEWPFTCLLSVDSINAECVYNKYQTIFPFRVSYRWRHCRLREVRKRRGKLPVKYNVRLPQSLSRETSRWMHSAVTMRPAEQCSSIGAYALESTGSASSAAIRRQTVLAESVSS